MAGNALQPVVVSTEGHVALFLFWRVCLLFVLPVLCGARSPGACVGAAVLQSHAS